MVKVMLMERVMMKMLMKKGVKLEKMLSEMIGVEIFD